MGTNNHGIQNADASSGKNKGQRKDYSDSYNDESNNDQKSKPGVEEYRSQTNDFTKDADAYVEAKSSTENDSTTSDNTDGESQAGNLQSRSNDPEYSDKGEARQKAQSEARKASNSTKG